MPSDASRARRAALERLTGPVAEGGLLLLAVGVPAALGGVHRPTILAATLVACLTTLVLWLHRRATHRGLRLTWFGGLLLGATGFTALQLLPLPVGLLRLLAPATVEVLEVSLAGAGGMPGWHPISLDPGATIWETLKIGACALAFIAAHNHYYRRERRRRMLVILVAGGVVITLLGFIGAVAAPGKALLLYTPESGRAGGLIATSFINPNHSSAFLTLCTVIAVGLAVSARDLQQRVLLGLGAVLLGGGVFLSLSRGGILALALAFGALALLLLFRPAGEGPRRAVALVPGALALILALSAWLAYEAIVAEFRQTLPELETNLGKIGLWPSGLRLALANPWVGVGRGAFLTAFPRYLGGDLPRTATYSHLENQYLHLPGEWGFPLAALLILGSAVALVLWFSRSRRGPLSAALAAGLFALAGHALVDFNLETLGVALPAVLVAGLLSAAYRNPVGLGATDGDPERQARDEESRASGKGSDGEEERVSGKRSDGEEERAASTGHEKKRRSLRSRSDRGRGKVHTGLIVGPALGLLLVTIWAGASDRPGADAELGRLSRLVQEGVPLDQLITEVRAVVRRHPADPFPHFLAGRLNVRARRTEALSWLNRAMFLYPGSPEIHLETAEALRRFGRRKQSLLEYRLALENGAPVHATVARALPLARSLEEVLGGLPDAPEPQAVAAGILISARLELARQLVQRARGRWPGSVEISSAEVEVLVAAREPERALAAARSLAEWTGLPETFELWARTAARVKPAGAGAELPILLEARRRFAKEERFAFALGEAYLRAHQIAKARGLAEEILGQASAPAALASAHDLLSRIHEADGRPHRARYEAEQARKLREGR